MIIIGTYCDPLGDWNVYGTLYPMVGKLLKDQVIMVSAKVSGYVNVYETNSQSRRWRNLIQLISCLLVPHNIRNTI